MGQMPIINTYVKKAKKPKDPTLAGRVAVIGAFDTELTGPQYCNNLDEAQTKLGSTEGYDGCAVLPILFAKGLSMRGVTGIIGVNITTTEESGGTTTVDKSITTTKLTNALASIKNEKFDILYIAGTLTDAFLPIITTFTEERFLHKMPVGFTGAVANTTSGQYTTTLALIDDSCYGVIANQTLKVKGTSYSLLQTSAYYCSLIAGSKLDYSFTQKVLPDVDGLGSEYTFESSDLGKELVVDGYTVFQCYDREDNEYCIVNSEQPNSWDIYINRVKDEVIRAFSLRDFFGSRNNPLTWGAILNECARVKSLYVEQLRFLEDITYRVEKESSKCVAIIIDSMRFADTITEMNVYITIEVE